MPAACMQQCDATPGAANTCPAGFHCNPDGTCDAQCTPNGNECGNGFTCTSDGNCVGDGSNDQTGPDAACPAVHYTPTRVTPSIELVLDRSGSMSMSDIAPNRYEALHEGLTGTVNNMPGAVTAQQANVYFGVALFASDEAPCLTMTNYMVPRALNNATAINTLIVNNPPNGGNTPTADAITQITANFALDPPPAGSPPIILLATDGEPNACDGGDGVASSLVAIGLAYAAGIKTYIIGLAGLETTYLQEVANVGTGQNEVTGTAPYYTANNPTQLATGIQTIINNSLSCDLTLTGMIDPSQAASGTLTLNGMTLVYGTDWTLDANGMTIHLMGTACTTLENSTNPQLDASFPCGAVIQ
ncbi:MAG TPA: vWA domain-containing protein [Kofleriaceae bacterium]